MGKVNKDVHDHEPNPAFDMGPGGAADSRLARHLAPDARPLRNAAAQAAERTRDWLLSQQHTDGYWCGELEGDTILESEFILLLAWLRRERSPIACKAGRYIAAAQLPDGGWTTYPGGPVDVSVSVKAYFALKLTGHDPQSEPMQRAREAILAHGGADAVNSFTRFYLALLGQIAYEHCPDVPPELVLLPRWFPVNLDRMSAWSRTIVVPLSIVSALKPVRQLDAEQGIAELFIRPAEQWPELRCPGMNPDPPLFSWDRFFRRVDRTIKWLARHRLMPLRRRAVRRAERWMVRRFVDSDGLGAIFPPIVWSAIALRCLGYDDATPEVRYCHEQLEALVIEQDDTVRLQPCKSPVWDTAIALRALAATGMSADDAAMQRAIEWLLSKEATRPGDWSHTVRCEPGGWFFEHHNAFYPDSDDTAMVLMALREVFPEDEIEPRWHDGDASVLLSMRAGDVAQARGRLDLIDCAVAACRRGQRWMRAMQNRDGGWGAFDKDNDCRLLCHVPFADHNAMIDPSTPDLSARVLEAFGAWGLRVGDELADRVVTYLRREQQGDGSWFGRWGVNYIYGTWQTIVGLIAVGVPPDDPLVVAGARWLIAHQQEGGGWGESPDSYADPALAGQGRPTASQTAWALLGLQAAGLHDHPAVARGIAWLLAHQRDDGAWDEAEFTGTGFPQVFYLRYHMYRIYFPLMALAGWRESR